MDPDLDVAILRGLIGHNVTLALRRTDRALDEGLKNAHDDLVCRGRTQCTLATRPVTQRRRQRLTRWLDQGDAHRPVGKAQLGPGLDGVYVQNGGAAHPPLAVLAGIGVVATVRKPGWRAPVVGAALFASNISTILSLRAS